MIELPVIDLSAQAGGLLLLETYAHVFASILDIDLQAAERAEYR